MTPASIVMTRFFVAALICGVYMRRSTRTIERSLLHLIPLGIYYALAASFFTHAFFRSSIGIAIFGYYLANLLSSMVIGVTVHREPCRRCRYIACANRQQFRKRCPTRAALWRYLRNPRHCDLPRAKASLEVVRQRNHHLRSTLNRRSVRDSGCAFCGRLIRHQSFDRRLRPGHPLRPDVLRMQLAQRLRLSPRPTWTRHHPVIRRSCGWARHGMGVF